MENRKKLTNPYIYNIKLISKKNENLICKTVKIR